MSFDSNPDCRHSIVIRIRNLVEPFSVRSYRCFDAHSPALILSSTTDDTSVDDYYCSFDCLIFTKIKCISSVQSVLIEWIQREQRNPHRTFTASMCAIRATTMRMGISNEKNCFLALTMHLTIWQSRIESMSLKREHTHTHSPSVDNRQAIHNFINNK